MYHIFVSQWGIAFADFLSRGKWGRGIGKGAKALTSQGNENADGMSFIEILAVLAVMVIFCGGLFLLIYLWFTISDKLKNR